MPEDRDIVKELRKAESAGVYDPKTMNPSIDYELDIKNNNENECQTEGFFKDETNKQAPGRSVLDLIFASTPIPVLFKNAKGIYTLVNDAACRFLGKSREEIIGTSDFELFPKDEAQRYTLIDKKVIATSKTDIQLTKVTCKNMKRWVKVSKTSVKRDGMIIGVLCYFLDVQEEKNLIKNLEMQKSEYGSLFDNMINSFAYHEIITDETGTPVDYVFLDVNSSFEKMTGLKKKEIIGKKVTEVLKGIETDPSDWIGKYGRVALHNEKIKFENYAEPLDKWYHVHAYSPRKGFFVTIFDDITIQKKMQKEIVGNIDQIKEAQEMAKMGRWDFDHADNCLKWSNTIFKIFEIERANFKESYESFLEFVHPEDQELVNNAWVTSLVDKKPYEIEHRLLLKDGTVKWVSEQCKTEFDEKGKPVHSTGIVQDITKRKEIEIRLQESKRYIDSILKAIPDVIFRIDKDGRYLDVIASFEDKLFLPKENLIGKKISEIFHGPQKHLFMDHIKRTIDTKSLQTIDYSIPTPLGELWFEARSVCLSENEIVSLVIDITDRKKAAHALRERQKELDMFFSQSLHGFFICMLDDPIYWNEQVDKKKALEYVLKHQRMTRVNQAMLDQYGAKEEDFIGITVEELFSHDLAHAREIWRGLFDRGRWHVETREQRIDDGKPIIIDGDYICLYDDKGRITGHFGVQVDITDIKLTEEKFQSQYKMLKRTEAIANIGSWEWDIEKDDVKWSEEFFRIAKIPAENGAPSFAEQSNLYIKEDYEKLRVLVETCISKGTEYETELRLIRRDGEIRHILALGQAETNEKGEINRLVGSIQDVTNRKKAEETLRESEEKLNTFFSQSLDGFFFMMLDEPVEWNESVDKEKTLDYIFHHQRMTKVNQAMLDQYKEKEEDFIGSTPYDLFKHDLDHGRYIWKGLFDNGRWHVETNERRKDGSEMWVLGDYICMYDSKGRITGHFGIQTDITQQKKTKLELQEKINALERYKKVTVDRELKMVELKKENSKLKKLLSKSNH